jgi:murein DD-endopeptidase MepM/ murein hydrolase activator NlpD
MVRRPVLVRPVFALVLGALTLDATPVVAAPVTAVPSVTRSGLRPQVVAATFTPPVDAPVRDPYRPPAQPYGPGNRGIEYDTVPGEPVRAAGDGIVAFAGAIGAARYVSIDHGSGLRTTYSYLQTLRVARGDRVRRGAVLGTTSEVAFHFGARLHGAYVDPAGLFGLVLPVRGVLVRIDEPWT